MLAERDFYFPLYKILVSDRINDEEKLGRAYEWTTHNINTIRRAEFKNTFKQANREDLLKVFIDEVDAEIGDIVKSRYYNRVGEIVGIKSDGETLVIKWDDGPIQNATKASVIKLTGKAGKEGHPVEELSDMENVKTQLNNYDSLKDKYIDTYRDVQIKTRESL